MKESYERDKRRASKRTRLDEASIDPDSWSKMNVSPAMIASEFKTLAEIGDYLYNELAIPSPQRLTPDRFKIDGKKVSGYFSEVAAHLNSEVKRQSSTDDTMSDRIKKLHSDIASFEWLSHVHEIFNNTLMDTSILVDEGNIDR